MPKVTREMTSQPAASTNQAQLSLVRAVMEAARVWRPSTMPPATMTVARMMTAAYAGGEPPGPPDVPKGGAGQRGVAGQQAVIGKPCVALRRTVAGHRSVAGRVTVTAAWVHRCILLAPRRGYLLVAKDAVPMP